MKKIIVTYTMKKPEAVKEIAETETIATEIFATHEQVKCRMQQLKDLLLEK